MWGKQRFSPWVIRFAHLANWLISEWVKYPFEFVLPPPQPCEVYWRCWWHGVSSCWSVFHCFLMSNTFLILLARYNNLPPLQFWSGLVCICWVTLLWNSFRQVICGTECPFKVLYTNLCINFANIWTKFCPRRARSDDKNIHTAELLFDIQVFELLSALPKKVFFCYQSYLGFVYTPLVDYDSFQCVQKSCNWLLVG